ncbi:MAG: hypothetical protein HY736_04005 [Verrucomicrobia bacterium]|nr:hypothetical protein [Verrucomicrobiota bacterium]
MLTLLFERQRSAEQRTAPPFAQLCDAAPAARRHPPRPSVAVAAVLLALPVGGAALLLLYTGPAATRQPGGVPRASAGPRADVSEISAWKAPTDVLLRPGSDATLMAPSESWTDALLPSPEKQATL